MNLCEGYPTTRQVLLGRGVHNLGKTDPCGYMASFVTTATDLRELDQANAKLKNDVRRNGRSEFVVPYTDRKSTQMQWTTPSDTMPAQETKTTLFSRAKSIKSFSSSTWETNVSTGKKHHVSNKRASRSMTIAGFSGVENERDYHGKKTKPFLLRTFSSSCLSLANKSRNKLISRFSCSDSFHSSSVDGGEHSNKDTRQIAEIDTRGVHARLKNSFRSRRSREITRRDSRILVTRLELELAITKNDKDKLFDFINTKILNINAKDYYGKTLLHTACSAGKYQCAQILINAGADIDPQDHSGFTPLHCAVVSNHVPCAAVMIDSGADVMATTRTMHTALTLAHEEEMILLIGRTFLLQGTASSREANRKKNCPILPPLRETML